MNLILLCQFGDERQTGAGRVLLDPRVNAAVQFSSEMIFPIASFALADKLDVRLCVVECYTVPPHVLHVDGFVLLEAGDLQMLRQADELLFGQRFVEEFGNALNLSSQILFEVFVKEEEHIG